MASVLNRTTKEFRASVNTPDFSSVDWLIMLRGDPGLADVRALMTAGVPSRYWKINGNRVEEMTALEKAAVDTAAQAANLSAAQATSQATIAAIQGATALNAGTADERIRALERIVFGA